MKQRDELTLALKNSWYDLNSGDRRLSGLAKYLASLLSLFWNASKMSA